MIDPHQDIMSQVEYNEGIDWAVMHRPELSERYSSNNLSADLLRTYLWKIAGATYPSKRGDPENDLRQTIFVAGALSAIVKTLPLTREAMAETFELGLEFSNIYGAERWKFAHFLDLKKKDASWWRKKKGDASPNQIVNALSSAWWRTFAKDKNATKTTKWEVLNDTLGTREMSALASLEKVTYREDGEYKSYVVEGDNVDFQMIAEPVWHTVDGRRILTQGAGEIVG